MRFIDLNRSDKSLLALDSGPNNLLLCASMRRNAGVSVLFQRLTRKRSGETRSPLNDRSLKQTGHIA